MQALLSAIKTRFDAQLTTLAPLYLDQIIEGRSKPYARYAIIDAPIDHAYVNYFQTIYIQFDLWVVGGVAALTAQEALHAAFDDVVLALSPTSGTETLVSADRINNRITRDGIDENSDEVYRAMSEYRFRVDKS